MARTERHRVGNGHIDSDQPNTPPSPDQIVEEAKRRIAGRPPTTPPQLKGTALKLNRGVFWLANHWVGLINAVILVYLAGTFVAPVLMHTDAQRAAGAVYAFYRPFCHQYPFRSWFLYGDAAAHPLHEPISLLKMNALSAYVGSPEEGYKIALCQRDVAIYGAMLVTGLAYGVARRFAKIRPLPLWLYFTFGIVPMLLDGGIQWLSYAIWLIFPGLLAEPFETIPLMRALTGALFGFGVIGVGYPYLAEYFDDVRDTLRDKYGWGGDSPQRSVVGSQPEPALGSQE